MLWTKRLNLTGARALSYDFCKDFGIGYCEVYYVDRLNGNYGEYIHLDPPHILVLETVLSRIGILIHELTHHLEYYGEYYKSMDVPESLHGYCYQLAKHRVVTWCRKSISTKPNWYVPLKARQSEKDLKEFVL